MFRLSLPFKKHKDTNLFIEKCEITGLWLVTEPIKGDIVFESKDKTKAINFWSDPKNSVI